GHGGFSSPRGRLGGRPNLDPWGHREVGEGDGAGGEGVNIVAAFLANRIELTESGFRLDGAFPEYWSIPEIPHTVELPIGFVASLEPEEVDETFLVEIQSGSAKAGGVVASGEFMFQRPPFTKFVDNTPLYVHAAV